MVSHGRTNAIAQPNGPFILGLVGLLIAWGLPLTGLADAVSSNPLLSARLTRELVWWTIGLIVLGWVLVIERQSLASIGLRRPTVGTLVWGVIFVVPLMASVMLCFAVIFPLLGLHQDMATTRSIVAVPLWLQTATMLRAGVVEEIIYRGYAIERLTMLTERRWLAAILAGAVFIAVHAGGWAPSQLIVVAFGTTILTALYLWRRDLVACMIAHALTDIIGFALARAHS